LRYCAAALLSLVACTSAAFTVDLIGQASIIDGDTLEIHGARIRLWGIDAPESSQLCRGEDSLQYRAAQKLRTNWRPSLVTVTRTRQSGADGSAGIPSGATNATRRIAEASSEQAIEMRNIREADV